MQLTWKVTKVFTKADLKKLEEYRQYVLKIADQEKGKSPLPEPSHSPVPANAHTNSHDCLLCPRPVGLYEEYFKSLSHDHADER